MTEYEFLALNTGDQQHTILNSGEVIVNYLQGSNVVKVYQLFTFLLKVTTSAEAEKIELLNGLEKFTLFQS